MREEYLGLPVIIQSLVYFIFNFYFEIFNFNVFLVCFQLFKQKLASEGSCMTFFSDCMRTHNWY